MFFDSLSGMSCSALSPEIRRGLTILARAPTALTSTTCCVEPDLTHTFPANSQHERGHDTFSTDSCTRVQQW